MKAKEQQSPHKVKAETTKLEGVIIGVLVTLDKHNNPLVVFPSNPQEAGVKAKSTTVFNKQDIGCEVALLFEDGDAGKPLIIGRIQRPEETKPTVIEESVEIDIDDEHLILKAKQSITLKCGKASITLTKAGKILIRGSYVLSRSSGSNRIKGGTIQIN